MNVRLQILVFSLSVVMAASCEAAKPSTADFQPPAHAEPPDTPLIGTLTMTAGQLQITEYVRASFFDPVSNSLPPFSFNYVSDGTDLIPQLRGLIPSEHPQFDFLLGPGRIW